MMVFVLCTSAAAVSQETQPSTDVAPATQSAAPAAPNRVTAVTIYQGTALVTREVQVKEGNGLMELIVSPLPAETIDSSLYSESSDGIRVLSTRVSHTSCLGGHASRSGAKDEQIKALAVQNAELQKDAEVINQNLQFLTKLEAFTGATLQQLTDKGVLNAESTMKLTTFVMDSRSEKNKSLVRLKEQIDSNSAAIAFAQRQLGELSAGNSRTEREAVIVVDKAAAAPGIIRFNYLVGAASWQPQYKLRAGSEKEAVQLEYLASIQQQSGEDWNGVDLVLSTAQPMLNAAPPDLLALDIAVTHLDGTRAGTAAP